MKKFLMICLVSFATTSAALADASLSEAGSRDLSGAVGQFSGTGAALVGVSVAMPVMSVGIGSQEIAGDVLGASLTQISQHNKNKRLPIAKEVIVPTPDQALKNRMQEN